MFNQCSKLEIFDLSNFNISKKTSMQNMFYNCSSLNVLDLSKFDTSIVTNMKSMFEKCSKLEYINLQIGIMNVNKYNSSQILDSTPENLILCSSDDSWQTLFLGYTIINCIDNNYFSNRTFKCFIKNTNISNSHICDICGANYYSIYKHISSML